MRSDPNAQPSHSVESAIRPLPLATCLLLAMTKGGAAWKAFPKPTVCANGCTGF
jgi:hypothetical protein